MNEQEQTKQQIKDKRTKFEVAIDIAKAFGKREGIQSERQRCLEIIEEFKTRLYGWVFDSKLKSQNQIEEEVYQELEKVKNHLGEK